MNVDVLVRRNNKEYYIKEHISELMNSSEYLKNEVLKELQKLNINIKQFDILQLVEDWVLCIDEVLLIVDDLNIKDAKRIIMSSSGVVEGVRIAGVYIKNKNKLLMFYQFKDKLGYTIKEHKAKNLEDVIKIINTKYHGFMYIE